MARRQRRGATGATPRLDEAPPWLLLAGLLLATVMATLDTQVVATALPTIAAQLHGLSLFGWVSTAYLLALAVVTPFAGKLGDLIGRRPVFLSAVSVFLAGSALCGLAETMPQLVACRALQGAGAGGLTVSVFALIGELFDPRQRARYQGLFAAVFVVSGLAGPVVGGVLTQHLGWRSVFYLNLPLGAVTLFAAVRFLHVARPAGRPRVDAAGTLLLGAAVSALVLAAGRTGSLGNTVLTGALVAAAVPLLAGFVLVELRVSEPVVPLALFRQSGFCAAAIVAFIGGAVALGLVSYLALFLQRAAGATTTTAGMLLIPGALGLLGGSALAGWYTGRSGRYRPLLVASMGRRGGQWTANHHASQHPPPTDRAVSAAVRARRRPVSADRRDRRASRRTPQPTRRRHRRDHLRSARRLIPRRRPVRGRTQRPPAPGTRSGRTGAPASCLRRRVDDSLRRLRTSAATRPRRKRALRPATLDTPKATEQPASSQ